MNVLSNIAQSNVGSYVGGGEDGSYNNQLHSYSMFNKNEPKRNASAGFTLLQGHIQLMAMVPNLPENQTSPRWKGSENRSNHHAVYEPGMQHFGEDSLSPPITPKMMPSASKYKRPHLTSMMMAGRANQWETPRSHSNPPLPPKNSQPITMPSFSKCLPGRKQTLGYGISMVPSTNYSRSENIANHLGSSSGTSCFPVISSQPTYQAVASPTVDLLGKDVYLQQQILEQQHFQIPTASGQMNPAYINPYNTTGTDVQYPPQMGYQMVNLVPPNQNQQQYEFFGGSGDHAMATVMHQIQQQQSYEQAAMAYPYSFHYQQQQYPQQQVFQPNNMFQYTQQQQQPPYAVQSMPCFGTPCTSSNMANFGIPNFPMSHSPSTNNNNNNKTLHHGVLPPSPTPESSHPVYSASMPEICLGTQSSQHCNSLPLLSRNGKKCSPRAGVGTTGSKKEVSIDVEDSSSTTSSSAEDENVCQKEKSKSSKSISVLKLREIQKEKKNKKAKHEAKYATLGPESNPAKIPSIPRVSRTPIRIKHPPENADHAEEETKEDDMKKEECRGEDGECCSRCKCCMKKGNNSRDEKFKDKPQQPQNLEEKVKELKNTLTPRRKGKPVVVAVHDIFPSDSSISEPESDLDSARRSCFNYVGSNGAMVRKRKPRIDAIFKTKVKGDSSVVFDDLENDLSPDEARTYNCDYLVELLTSDDWNNCYTSLQIIVRLARHRPKVLLNYLSGPILWYTFKHITSPKSALCRAAIVTFKELFETIASALDNDLDKITEKLVLKSLAPNMFIREECDRALEAMVGHCNLVKVLNAMDIVSKKPHARAVGHRLARMGLQLVHVAGVDMCLKPVYAEKLLPMLFSFMTEANNGTRTAAKEALGLLMNHLQFETAVTRHVTFDKNCTEVFKKLDKMRGRNRNRRQMGNSRHPLPHAHFRR